MSPTNECQDAEIDRLIQLLKSHNLGDRNIAAKQLGTMRESAKLAIPQLILMLKDDTCLVFLAATPAPLNPSSSR
jgi:HEAT repeat protein